MVSRYPLGRLKTRNRRREQSVRTYYLLLPPSSFRCPVACCFGKIAPRVLYYNAGFPFFPSPAPAATAATAVAANTVDRISRDQIYFYFTFSRAYLDSKRMIRFTGEMKDRIFEMNVHDVYVLLNQCICHDCHEIFQVTSLSIWAKSFYISEIVIIIFSSEKLAVYQTSVSMVVVVVSTKF